MAPLVMLAISAAVSIGGQIVSYLIKKGEDDKARKIIESARDEYGQIQPEKLEEAAFGVLGPSAFEQIQTNPEFQKAQLESLDSIKELQEQGGFNAEDRANLNRIRNETARRASSRNAMLRDEMQARGIGGSGAELALRQMEGQHEADLNMQTGLDVSAQAQKRYFDAVRERARMAGDMRAQEFGEKAAKAQAADQIARYNHAFLADQHWRNQDIKQRNFNNRLGIAQGRLGLAQDRAGDISRAGERVGNMVGGIARDTGQAIYAGGSMMGQGGGETPSVVTQAISSIPKTANTFAPENYDLRYPPRPMQFRWGTGDD